MSEDNPQQEIETTRCQLERLKRLYSMLSRINRTIVRAESPNVIYSAACHIVVEEGNFRSAVIALMEPLKHTPISVASAGVPVDLQRLPLSGGKSTSGDNGSCLFIQGKPCVVNNIQTDPRTNLARSDLAASGIQAIASFPLLLENSLIGTLTVGVGETDYFGETELHLLEEVANDISFAVDVIRRDEKRLAGEAKMHYLAHYDGRTGLPGRHLFEKRLATICRQDSVSSITVMVINLRNYHAILQALGLDAGILIAQTVVARIEALLPTAIAARLSESEYALALDALIDPHEIEQTAMHIQRIVAKAIAINQQDIFLDSFIGIAIFPKDGAASELVEAALTATDKTFQERGTCCRFFVPGMGNKSRKRLDLDTALRRAIKRQEFVLYYQPQVNLVTGRMVGAEAVLRWRHPDKGLVLPMEFIAALEESGLICEVGEWAMFEACAACHRWQMSGQPPVRVAVNLSGRQFRDSDIGALVKRALNSAHLDPSWLELEVTESIILPNATRVIRTLRDLNAIGVSQALDDFGTGYSSLSYLQRLPVQRLKIDRSFIVNITSCPNNAAIVRAVISMAHSLGISVIAEGVETESQLGYLRDLNCDEMQGYHFDPPLPEGDFNSLLREGRCIPSQTGHSEQKRVLLLVDDEPNALSLLHHALKNTDIHLLCATNPYKAFDLLAKSTVGVVICNQHIPEIAGFEFLNRIKNLYPTTVRIALSSHTDINTVLDAVNHGAIYKFLTKPFEKQELLKNLDDAFHLHEVEQENFLLNRKLRDLMTAAAVSEEHSYTMNALPFDHSPSA
ncbi:MAG: EAL domain-containing protein [Candidatus Thiodiazotropha sp.]